MNTAAETLWKVTVSSFFPNDHRVESSYEGRHADEKAAHDAALSKEAIYTDSKEKLTDAIKMRTGERRYRVFANGRAKR